MTALFLTSSNGYSCTAANQAAKTSVQSTTGNENSTNNDLPHDVLTISAEGLDALSKIENAEIYKPQEMHDLIGTIKKPIFGGTVENKFKYVFPTISALGITAGGETFNISCGYLSTEESMIALREQLQNDREKIDSKISDILQSNDITLDGDETLNIAVDHTGEITVGDGVRSEKKERIEQLLNEDKTLGQDLLFTHAEHYYTVESKSILRGLEAGGEQDHTQEYIMIDTILRRDYGISLNDLRLTEADEGVVNEYERWHQQFQLPQSVVAKDGNNEVMDNIQLEEPILYSHINEILNEFDKNGGTFEVNYTYKNGVTIEEGATDMVSLSKAASTFMPKELRNLGVQTSVTIVPTGSVKNFEVTSFGQSDNPVRVMQQLELYYDFGNITSMRSNTDISPIQSRLQQFAFDAQRLFQFNTGMNEDAIKAMNVTFAANSK